MTVTARGLEIWDLPASGKSQFRPSDYTVPTPLLPTAQATLPVPVTFPPASIASLGSTLLLCEAWILLLALPPP